MKLDTSLCYQKKTLSMELSYTYLSNLIELKISCIQNFQESLISALEKSLIILINNFKNGSDFLYSISRKNEINFVSDAKFHISFLISFAYFQPIIGGQTLIVEMNLSYEDLALNNLSENPQSSSIALMDFSTPLDPKDVSKINNALAGDDVNQAITTSVVSAMCFLPGQSKFSSSVRGLMLIELTFLLKFMKINYPENLRQYFMLKVNNTKPLLFKQKFENIEEDLNEIPLLFRYYHYSPYFLNNVGDPIFMNLLFLGIAYVVLLIEKAFNVRIENKNNKKWLIISKILDSLSCSFVWANVLISFLTSFQLVFFYILCSFQFSSFSSMQSQFNFSCSFISFCFRILILGYFIKIIEKCQKQRRNMELVNESTTKQTYFKIDQIYDSKRSSHIDINSGILNNQTKNNLNDVKKNLENDNNNKIDQMPVPSNQTQEENIIIVSNLEHNSEIATIDCKTTVVQPIIKIQQDFIISQNRPSESQTNEENLMSSKFPKRVKKSQILPESPSSAQPQTVLKNKILDRYEIIYKEYNLNSVFSKYFTMIDLSRLCLFALIVACFYESPLFQIIIMNLIEWIYVIFTLKKSPFQTWHSLISFIGNEILLMIILFCCLIIELSDQTGQRNYVRKEELGWTIIYSNFTFRFWVCLISFWKILEVAYEDMKKKKLERKIKNTSDK